MQLYLVLVGPRRASAASESDAAASLATHAGRLDLLEAHLATHAARLASLELSSKTQDSHQSDFNLRGVSSYHVLRIFNQTYVNLYDFNRF